MAAAGSALWQRAWWCHHAHNTQACATAHHHHHQETSFHSCCHLLLSGVVGAARLPSGNYAAALVHADVVPTNNSSRECLSKLLALHVTRACAAVHLGDTMGLAPDTCGPANGKAGDRTWPHLATSARCSTQQTQSCKCILPSLGWIPPPPLQRLTPALSWLACQPWWAEHMPGQRMPGEAPR